MDYGKLPNYAAAMSKYTESVAKGSSDEEQKQLFANAMDVMGAEIVETLGAKTTDQINELMALRPDALDMSADETKFFDAITSGLGNVEVTLPEQILNQVFDELTVAHPLLDIVKFQNAGIKAKAITSDGIYNGGNAEWGTFAGDIKGQLSQAFKENDFSQNKLTAFIVIPKDALDYSYPWLKTFIILQLSEAIAVALESAIVVGDGNNKPIGLMKDLTKGSVTGGVTTYADKADGGDLSNLTPENAAIMLAPLVQKLAVNEKDIPVNVSGQIKLLVNPQDYYSFVSKFLYLNAQGVWVDVLPFGVQVVQSIAVPAGKAVLFVANRYWAYTAGMKVQEFDQTYALQDLQLYTTKSFYYGRAFDNNTSLVVKLSGTATKSK